MQDFEMKTRDEESIEFISAKTCANASSNDGTVVIVSSLLTLLEFKYTLPLSRKSWAMPFTCSGSKALRGLARCPNERKPKQTCLMDSLFLKVSM
jgi:hypothetical protein